MIFSRPTDPNHNLIGLDEAIRSYIASYVDRGAKAPVYLGPMPEECYRPTPEDPAIRALLHGHEFVPDRPKIGYVESYDCAYDVSVFPQFADVVTDGVVRAATITAVPTDMEPSDMAADRTTPFLVVAVSALFFIPSAT